MGIACHLTMDKKYIVEIEYRDLYRRCNICELPYLYDNKGESLTKSQPVFLEHPKNKSGAGPYGNYPNIIEYNVLFKKLKLNVKEYNYIYIPFDIDNLL